MQSFIAKFNFHSSKLMLYLPKAYVFCIYSATSQSPKPLTNCLNIAEASVVLIVFDDVFYQVRAYTVDESGTRKA